MIAFEALSTIGCFDYAKLKDGTGLKLFTGEVDNGWIASYWTVKDGRKDQFVISASGRTAQTAKENLKTKILDQNKPR